MQAMRLGHLWLILPGLLLSVGCDQAPQATHSPSSSRSSTGAPPPPPSGPEGTDQTDEAFTEVPSSHEDAASGYQRQVVSVGADKRGRNYGGGVITEPIRQYFRASQRINLLNLKRAMDLYKAGNNNKLPDTHEDFMEEIVEANSIELPQLPDGERYVFDTQLGELMVQRPTP